MLLTLEQISHAAQLSITQVRDAMARGGYQISAREITGVDFLGQTETGSFVYSIAGPDPEGDGDDVTLGNVYLRWGRAPMKSGFELYGDY